MGKNIWTDGFTVKREGGDVVLTSNEIREIYNQIEAANGRGSIEYYLDTKRDDLKYENDDKAKEDIKKEISMSEKLLEDDDKCRAIWNEYLECIFYDTGAEEYEVVDDFVKNSLGENA